MSYATVTVPGVVQLAPSAVTIEEMAGQHDLATLTLDSGTEGADLFKNSIGMPVMVQIVDGAYIKTMIGYLDTFMRGTDSQQYKDTFFVLGASSIMRSGTPKTWRAAKPINIAKELVAAYNFGLEFDTYGYTLPSFTQSADSDWEALRALSREIGFFLIPAGTTMRLVHPTQEIRRQMRNILPVFTVPTVNGVSTNVAEFAVIDTKSAIGFENTVYTGSDKMGNFFSVTADTGATVTRKSRILTQSVSEAMAAAERQKARSYLQRRASMTINGGANLFCGGCVGVREPSKEQVWMIVEIKHVWYDTSNFGVYSSSMSLCRPDTDLNIPAAYRDVSARPGSISSGGNWRADRQWVVEL